MISNFITVIQQVILLTAIIGVGFLFKKTRLIDDSAVRTLTNLTLYAAIPCLLIKAFEMEYSSAILSSFFLEMLIAAIVHAMAAVLGFLAFKRAGEKKKRVYICCLCFSNVGFMGYPLLSALFGNIGLFYGSAYNLVFNAILWSIGIKYLENESEKVNLKEVLLNPNIVGAFIGFIVFIGQIHIPDLLETGMGYLSALAVPLPLIVIGARLTELKISSLAGDKFFWGCAALKLLIIPAIAAFLLHAVGIRGELLQATVIVAATPTASILGMVAGKNDPETGSYTAGVISGITALSMLTIPVAALIASILA